MHGYKLESIFGSFIYKTRIFFIGTYIRGAKSGTVKNESLIDIYVIGKTLLSFAVLFFNLYSGSFYGNKSLFYYISIYFIVETLHYNILHILCADKFDPAISFKRNLILGFFNYLEVSINFAVLYAANDVIKYTTTVAEITQLNWIDYLYFSFVVGGTIGFGDLIAIGNYGHVIIIFQIITFLVFFGLFITHNVTKFINKPAR